MTTWAQLKRWVGNHPILAGAAAFTVAAIVAPQKKKKR